MTTSEVTYSLTHNMTHNMTSGVSDSVSYAKRDAFIYIIAVLGFYSIGVVCMMVKYLQEEKRDLEEEILLEQFMKNKPQTANQQRAKPFGRLALDAFNAANLVVQPSSSDHGRVTFV